jgi:hypothetical protein
MPITLPPSTDTDALTNAIRQATDTNQPLVLLPGVHLTKPGYNLQIPIGANGLNLSASGTSAAQIKRPDFSIGTDPTDPAHHRDDNFGLRLVPAKPLDLQGVQWKTFTPPPPAMPFQFAVILRGAVRISGVTVDCNMGNQHLEGLKNEVEHNAMLAISGQGYSAGTGPGGIKRTVYVGFEEVSLDKVNFVRGGFADDLWFPPGYFHPNIVRVNLSNITSQQRVNQQRATISFSGLSLEVSILNCELDSLHCEVDDPWSDNPRKDDAFVPSTWGLDHVRANAMGIAAKGHVLNMKASNLTITQAFGVHFAGGAIVQSSLAVSLEDRRLFRLKQFHFGDCTWILKPDATGRVYGIVPATRFGDEFVGEFVRNRFVVDGNFTSGELIATGDYSTQEPHNKVTAKFLNCHYQPGFGSPAHPNTHVASLHERGDYTFSQADLAGLNPNQAIVKGPEPDIHLQLV